MVYEIVMPQLSDSMEEGKLIAWRKNVGEHVEAGDVIAEVESDKAIMEIQTFKAGTLSERLLKEGESAPVGSVIARIDTDAKSASAPSQTEASKQRQRKESQTKERHLQTEHAHPLSDTDAILSPKAKEAAAKYALKDTVLHAYATQTPLHQKDIERIVLERYFTKKAQQLLRTYRINPQHFKLDHKIDSYEVKALVQKEHLPESRPLERFEKALIANVTASAAKPTYRIYEEIDATRFLTHQNHGITAWLVKLLAEAMMRHPRFRSRIENERILTYETASIAVAVADENALYMPVVKNAQNMRIEEISNTLEDFKTKLQTKSFTKEELSGSTFGLSNLGMFGVRRFDAMINKDDCGIAAAGAIGKENTVPLTLTLDHRLINGRDAALFVQTLKKLAQEEKNFKE